MQHGGTENDNDGTENAGNTVYAHCFIIVCCNMRQEELIGCTHGKYTGLHGDNGYGIYQFIYDKLLVYLSKKIPFMIKIHTRNNSQHQGRNQNSGYPALPMPGKKYNEYE